MNLHYAKVAARAGHRCEYCHAPEAAFNFPFEVEHIVPELRGGKNDEANMALACRACNVFKSHHVIGSDSQTNQEANLFHPRHDRWDLHFRVNQDTGEIDGLTPVGRATVAKLRLNEPFQLSARMIWMRLGLFP